MSEHVYVYLEWGCTDADLVAVTQAFDEVGIRADVRGSIIKLSMADHPWDLVIMIPVAIGGWAFFKAALQGAGDEAGREGWHALMHFVRKLYEKRNASSSVPEGTVLLDAAYPPAQVRLPSDLPDVAYQRLYEFADLRAPLSGVLIWDRDAELWRDPLVDARVCQYPNCSKQAAEQRARCENGSVCDRRFFCEVHTAAADMGDEQAWK
jgi:hypothetical protein